MISDSTAVFPEAEEGHPLATNTAIGVGGDYYEYAEEGRLLLSPSSTAKNGRRRWIGKAGVLGGLASVATIGGCMSRAFIGANLTSSGGVTKSFAGFWDRADDMWGWNLKSLGDDDWNVLFREFYVRFDKSKEYNESSPEYYKRRETFRKNIKKIHDHNRSPAKQMKSSSTGDEFALYEGESVTLAPNQFTDMNWKEFRDRHLTYNDRKWERAEYTSRIEAAELLAAVANSSLPESVNWIDRGCVTPVKDQSHCGSCWAFSATGALEGAYCAQTGQLLSFSEQQLVDCARPEGTMGCHGGLMDNAFQYIIDNQGICGEEDYPYKGVDTLQCMAKKCKSEAKVRGILDLPPHDEKALKAALAFYGPVAVAIEADRPVFQFYHKGVLLGKCGKHLNHAVLAVGYDQEKADSDGEVPESYWLIKNSWGVTWGDQGYIKLTRDKRKKNGECGMLLAPVIPIVDTHV